MLILLTVPLKFTPQFFNQFILFFKPSMWLLQSQNLKQNESLSQYFYYLLGLRRGISSHCLRVEVLMQSLKSCGLSEMIWTILKEIYLVLKAHKPADPA